jgi:hypothetical protein
MKACRTDPDSPFGRRSQLEFGAASGHNLKRRPRGGLSPARGRARTAELGKWANQMLINVSRAAFQAFGPLPQGDVPASDEAGVEVIPQSSGNSYRPRP